jgi:hypothetical protein
MTIFFSLIISEPDEFSVLLVFPSRVPRFDVSAVTLARKVLNHQRLGLIGALILLVPNMAIFILFAR